MNTYKKDLFDLFQLDKISPEKSVETLDRLSKLIFQAVLVRVLPTLSEDKMNEYEKIVTSNDGDVLFNFLKESVENFDEILKEESENLRIELSK